MTAKVDKDKCTGCETCVDECPAVAITLENEKAKVDKDLCVDCESLRRRLPVRSHLHGIKTKLFNYSDV